MESVFSNAVINAYYRYYHSKNDTPKIFDDFLAYKFLTENQYAGFGQQFLKAFKGGASAKAAFFPNEDAALAWIMQRWTPLPLVVSRSRYAEDMLEEAIRQGAKQYVILGAGMDTFAFRRKELIDCLKVFEADHPSTQAYKRSRLAELGWELPRQLHFVPVDFTSDNLAISLNNSPYDSQVPSFLSLLGVTPYLTNDEVFSTLRSIREISASGSMIIFDYCDKAALIPEGAGNRVHTGIMQMKETILTSFDPSTLAVDLNRLGFRILEHLSPSNIEKRYFKDRTDDYHAYEYAYFVCAEVE